MFPNLTLPASSGKILSVFYHIWVWWPSWSCDPDFVIKLSFPSPVESEVDLDLGYIENVLMDFDS